MTKVQRANTIIQDGLNASGIIEMPKDDNVTGIIILRIVHNKGIHSTCIGAIDFKISIKALKNFEQHAAEYDLRNSEQNAT